MDQTERMGGNNMNDMGVDGSLKRPLAENNSLDNQQQVPSVKKVRSEEDVKKAQQVQEGPEQNDSQKQVGQPVQVEHQQVQEKRGDTLEQPQEEQVEQDGQKQGKGDAEAGSEFQVVAQSTSESNAATFNLGPGSRIEVMWDIKDDDGSLTAVWWQATILKKGEPSDDNSTTFEIEYEPLPPHFPEKERGNVVFKEEHILCDVDQDMSELPWRPYGSTYEVPPNNQPVPGLEGPGPYDETVSSEQPNDQQHFYHLNTPESIQQIVGSRNVDGNRVYTASEDAMESTVNHLVDGILQNFLAAHHQRFMALPAAQQNAFTDRVMHLRPRLQNRLIDAMRQNNNTLDDAIVQQVMEDLARELQQ